MAVHINPALDHDLISLINEDIYKGFGKAKFLDIDIIVCKKTGYVNATHLCHQDGKEVRVWRQNDASKEFIEHLSSDLVIPTAALLFTRQGNGSESYNLTKGTFVHPDLLTDICSWISPEFKLKVSRIIKAYANARKQKEIYDLTNKNCDLSAELKKLREDMARDRAEQKAEHEEQVKKLDEAINEIRDLKSIVNGVVQLITKPRRKSEREMILIYRLKGESREKLHIHACMKSSVVIPPKEKTSYLFVGDNIVKC